MATPRVATLQAQLHTAASFFAQAGAGGRNRGAGRRWRLAASLPDRRVCWHFMDRVRPPSCGCWRPCDCLHRAGRGAQVRCWTSASAAWVALRGCAWLHHPLAELPCLHAHARSVCPGRVAYHHGLKGPAVAVDTACASSLVALNSGALGRGQLSQHALACCRALAPATTRVHTFLPSHDVQLVRRSRDWAPAVRRLSWEAST